MHCSPNLSALDGQQRYDKMPHNAFRAPRNSFCVAAAPANRASVMTSMCTSGRGAEAESLPRAAIGPDKRVLSGFPGPAGPDR